MGITMAKNKIFRFRMSFEQWRSLQKKSEESSLTPSEYLRRCSEEPLAFIDANLKKIIGMFTLSEKNNYQEKTKKIKHDKQKIE